MHVKTLITIQYNFFLGREEDVIRAKVEFELEKERQKMSLSFQKKVGLLIFIGSLIQVKHSIDHFVF